MSQILLLEDEDTLRKQLADFLTANGMIVKAVATVAAAHALDPKNFELAILDWNLADGEGIDVVRKWRAEKHLIPVIMLTARTDVVDRVVGLEVGADDYVLKPYEPRELLARVRAHLRRKSGAETSSIIRAGNIAMDLEKFECTLTDEQDRTQDIELSKMEFDLLALLVRAAGKVFTRDELLSRVWGLDSNTETRTVDAHIAKLRSKLGESTIETVRGVGYRILSTKKQGRP